MRVKTGIARAGLFLAAVLHLSAPQALANTGEMYGFGSRASGMGNTTLSTEGDGFETFYNPAINSARPGARLTLAFMFLKPSFKRIDGIVIKNSVFNPTLSPVTGDIPNDDYNNHVGQALGASINFGEKLKNLAVGLVGFLSVERIAYMDTGEPFKPEYFNYRSRTQRPQFFASLSLEPFRKFYLGAGLAFATNMTANATILTTTADNSASSARFTASLKPSVAPYFGIYTEMQRWKYGATVRLKNRYKTSLDTGADFVAFNNRADFSIVLNAASSLYYDPFEIDLAVSCQIDPKTLLSLELGWFEYAAFEPPTLTIERRPGGSIATRNSISTAPEMKNIVVPKVGLEHVFGRVTGRFGFWYRPSPVVDNKGSGNLVDPDKLVASLGMGFDLQKLNLTEKKIRIDVHGQYHHLFHKHVEKSPGNELGDLNQSKIGSPGYGIGGHIYGGGVSATVEI